jgi:hypothetical protein
MEINPALADNVCQPHILAFMSSSLYSPLLGSRRAVREEAPPPPCTEPHRRTGVPLHSVSVLAPIGSYDSLFFCNFDSVGEPYAENDLWQLVLSIEATPLFLGGLSKLEDHGESGLVQRHSQLNAIGEDPAHHFDNLPFSWSHSTFRLSLKG